MINMNINDYNIMLSTDSYKISHANMLPNNLTYMETYAEARGGKYPYTLFFDMQYYIKKFLTGVLVTEEKIQEAKELYSVHFGNDNVFPEEKWRYILTEHGGKLPIKILSVKEGSIVPVKNVLFKVHSTDPNCAWVVGIVETILMRLWYPITVATNSLLGKEILDHHKNISGDLDTKFSLHDFGYRGVASEEQAQIGGAAHLLNFAGTDTVAGIRMLMKYYNTGIQGFSVPASEHSVMSIRGKSGERQVYIDAFKAYPTGILSLVSDTYDIYNVCEMLGTDEELRNLILNRDGKLVIRPDSGEPIDILCGTNNNDNIDNNNNKTLIGYKKGKLIRNLSINEVILNFKVESPNLYKLANDIINGKQVEDNIYSSQETDNQKNVYNYFEVKNNKIIAVGEERIRDGGWYWSENGEDIYENIPIYKEYKKTTNELIKKGLFQIIWDLFGGTINEKGYKVLNPKISFLWGDGVSVEKIHTICSVIEHKGWSVDNIIFGGGKEVLQNFNRDDIKFAIKCSFAKIGDDNVDVFKDPITGKSKKSKKGQLSLYYNEEVGYYTINQYEQKISDDDKYMLIPVFENGELLNETSYDEIIKHIDDELIKINKTYKQNDKNK